MRSSLVLRRPGWLLGTGSATPAFVDFDFVNARYFGTMPSCSRASTAFALTAAGLLAPFATNVLRITDQGLLIEEARTNVVLWSRDLTNAAWTASSVTVAKDQIGADGTANAASSLTATGANGTVLQAITLASSARFQSAFVKRLTGSGTVEMTTDNGATWTAIVLTASYQQLSIPTQTLANPTVGFRIVTSGDALAVDFVQNENGVFKTSPIATTTASVTRAVDVVSLLGKALVPFSGEVGSDRAGSVVVESGPIFGTVAGLQRFVGITGGRLALYLPTNARGGIYSGAADLQTVDSGANWNPGGGVKAASSWGPSIRSVVKSNGAVATDSGVLSNLAVTSAGLGGAPGTGIGPLNGYIRRATFWNVRLPDAVLKAFTV